MGTLTYVSIAIVNIGYANLLINIGWFVNVDKQSRLDGKCVYGEHLGATYIRGFTVCNISCGSCRQGIHIKENSSAV